MLRASVMTLLFAGCAATTEAQEPVPAGMRSQAQAGFWEHWGDSQAEINTYALTQPRYGEERPGEAVLVFVTETFADDVRVKSDGGHDVEYPVLKLNEARDFNTGIYDYNVMTSTFLRVDGGSSWGLPVKTSHSAQEWCGHIYEQLIPRDGVVHRTSHSYFDGEADRSDTVDVPANAVFADALPIVVRGLVGTPEGAMAVQLMDRSIDARFNHVQGAFREATLTWGATESVTVPMGTFQAQAVTVDVETGPDATYYVETAAPHRLIRWTRTDGEEGALVASTRTAYWGQNHNRNEGARAELSLSERQWPGR